MLAVMLPTDGGFGDSRWAPFQYPFACIGAYRGAFTWPEVTVHQHPLCIDTIALVHLVKNVLDKRSHLVRSRSRCMERGVAVKTMAMPYHPPILACAHGAQRARSIGG